MFNPTLSALPPPEHEPGSNWAYLAAAAAGLFSLLQSLVRRREKEKEKEDADTEPKAETKSISIMSSGSGSGSSLASASSLAPVPLSPKSDYGITADQLEAAVTRAAQREALLLRLHELEEKQEREELDRKQAEQRHEDRHIQLESSFSRIERLLRELRADLQAELDESARQLNQRIANVESRINAPRS